jgi:hypothetical protein
MVVLGLLQKQETAGPTPCRFRILKLLFAPIDGFLQFRTGSELGHAAGRYLDGRASLGIATIACLALRD